MTAFTVSVEAAELVGESHGNGPGLVFLHAGVADRRSWTELQRQFSSMFTTVAYDRRGFGESRYEPGPFSHLADLEAVLDHLDLDRASLVGNSMGGALALDFALAHPDRTESLFLIGSGVSGAPDLGDSPPPVLALEEALVAADRAGDLEEVNRLEAWFWLDGPVAREGRVSGPLRDLFLDMNGRALSMPRPGDEPARPPAFDRLEKLSAPAVVLVGSLDEPYLIDLATIIADRLPAGRFVQLEGVAHLPAMERPDLVAPILHELLDSI